MKKVIFTLIICLIVLVCGTGIGYYLFNQPKQNTQQPVNTKTYNCEAEEYNLDCKMLLFNPAFDRIP